MALSPVEIILKKRYGEALSADEIEAFVKGAVDGSFDDGQLAALLMAIAIRGMTDRETLALSLAMAHSGDMLDLSGISGAKADKHSTGGVADTTTLILAPLVAACGVKVLKMSGRGLGHTGGTIDKLLSIPGFSVELTGEAFMRQAEEIGLAIIGQTKHLAPADKKLYALRDVTGTVDSLPLIASSILSKKLASGCDCVVLDVKAGSGALMKTAEAALELAEEMVKIGVSAGKKYTAVVTDMNQPLGQKIGNALEVEEAIEVLRGDARGALYEVSLVLGAHMLVSAGRAKNTGEARGLLEGKLNSGDGLLMLQRMIEAQGGDARVTDDLGRLPRAREVAQVTAKRSGYVSSIETSALGDAARFLGAGRLKLRDVIDPAVGIVMHCRIGDCVERGDSLMTLHMGRASGRESAMALIDSALTIADEKPAALPLILREIGV